MRYAISTWNFREPGVTVFDLVERFAALGFDAMSFLPEQLLQLGHSDAERLSAMLRERSLLATVHGNFELTAEQARQIIAILGASLYSLTMDAARTADSRGQLFDVARMASLLTELEEVSRGTEVQLAVEDFPLDALALDYYRPALRKVLDNSRYGILVDIGHMNIRRCSEPYYRELSVAEYFARIPLRIVEVHVHDNLGEKDSHGHLGFGNIQFAEVAEALRKLRFDGVSTIETCPYFHNRKPREAMPFVKPSLETWRRYFS